MRAIYKFIWKNQSIVTRLFFIVLGVFFAESIFAAPTAATSLTALETNIHGAVSNFAKILQDIALVTGIGFVIASFFKFHQHKLNPTQVPISQGVTLLVIGAGLAVFPHIITIATKSVFGTGPASFGSSPIGGGTTGT